MELYIGGFAQGKLNYVLEKYRGRDVLVYDKNNVDDLSKYIHTYSAVDSSTAKNINENAETEDKNAKAANKVVIINKLNEIIRNDIFQFDISDIIVKYRDLVNSICEIPDTTVAIISDEIGCGIVPIDKADREYREQTGRLLTEIAKKCESVERIICGIPCRIK